MSLDNVNWNFSQFIIPLISNGFVSIFSGVVSRVRSSGEWSEWGFDRLSMLVLNLFGILETNISRISCRFLGDVGQYVGFRGKIIE